MADPEFIARARALVPADSDLAYAWHGTTEALASDWTTVAELRRCFTERIDLGRQEYDLEFVQEGVLVHFISTEVTCDPAELLALLDQLERPPQPPPTSDLAEKLGRALGLELDDLAGGDLDGFLKTLGSLVEDLRSSDPDQRSRGTERARALASDLKARGIAGADRLAALPDLLQTTQDQLDTERLAGHLRTLADWLEDQDSATGQKVDDIIASLEAGLGKVLGHQERRDAETDERIRTNARGAIANALRNLGLKVDRTD